ncbi:ATP-binding protein [Citromicrobium bathyomarinum]|uniref:ATP-binding protein n=1 Tax=Sphingomonadales TaxID=204457 RepID=UPI000C37709E|nr:ATP-binding protein [Citromicrobium sp.]MBO82267.1 ATP-binding protein [Citromicrobium sp.]|tara:strand:+ start:31522 stop:33015 length:1494 start_codon:yes stop_codon:yes gene_type:complete
MTAQIEIGTDSAGQGICVDIEELLATRLLVQGNSGSGKSHLLRRLLEQTAGLVQQVVIDPEGDFTSLADEFDHIVIDGAAHSVREIEALAGRVRQHRVSVVLALDELEVEQQIRCAALFLGALFDAPREHWYPALVVVDEAQMFAPAAAGELAEETRRLTLSAMTNLMCRGRKRGLAGIVATQRLAKLAKNVAAEASNFLMGRTFLDIDMQRAADLLGMDRRQAERIRDLQRGHFLGLGPAISRRPVAVHIGEVRTGGKNAAEGLMPLPQAKGEELEALLHSELAEEAAEPVRPAPPPRPAPDLEQAITERAAAQAEREESGEPLGANEPSAGVNNSPGPQDGEAAITRIVAELAGEEGATFQSSAVLFRNFAQRCRQQGVPSAHVDMLEFRRLFAFASARLHELQSPMREAIEELAQGVPEDVLAPYLALAVAAAQGRPAPDEDELARVYGSSSPSRIRRLLEHLERQGLIVVREEFGGGRTIIVTGLEEAAAAES